MDQLESSAASKTLTWTESHTIDSIIGSQWSLASREKLSNATHKRLNKKVAFTKDTSGNSIVYSSRWIQPFAFGFPWKWSNKWSISNGLVMTSPAINLRRKHIFSKNRSAASAHTADQQNSSTAGGLVQLGIDITAFASTFVPKKSWAVLSFSTVYYAVQGGSNFQVCGRNPSVPVTI